MNAVQTFFAIIKGYCAVVIILLPNAFKSGGYIFSPIMIAVSGALTTRCALKLVDCGIKTKIMNYPLLTRFALGRNGQNLSEVMIALTQYSFTITYITFIYSTIQSITLALWGFTIDPYLLCAIIALFMIPLALVRKI